jgi:hypothetical protein
MVRSALVCTVLMSLFVYSNTFILLISCYEFYIFRACINFIIEHVSFDYCFTYCKNNIQAVGDKIYFVISRRVYSIICEVGIYERNYFGHAMLSRSGLKFNLLSDTKIHTVRDLTVVCLTIL